jgi:hypothetical protein
VRGAAYCVRLLVVGQVVEYISEAGLMSVRIGATMYLLGKDDLAIAGAVLVRLLAEGHSVTPTMLPAVLHRSPSQP